MSYVILSFIFCHYLNITFMCSGREFDWGDQLWLFELLLLFLQYIFNLFFFFLAIFVVDVQNVFHCFFYAIVMGSWLQIALSCLEYSFWCSNTNLKVAGFINPVLFDVLVTLLRLLFTLVDRSDSRKREGEAVFNTKMYYWEFAKKTTPVYMAGIVGRSVVRCQWYVVLH